MAAEHNMVWKIVWAQVMAGGPKLQKEITVVTSQPLQEGSLPDLLQLVSEIRRKMENKLTGGKK